MRDKNEPDSKHSQHNPHPDFRIPLKQIVQDFEDRKARKSKRQKTKKYRNVKITNWW